MILNWTGLNYYVQSSIIIWPYGLTSSGDITGPELVSYMYGR